MTQEINHYSVVCGKGYHACDSCSEVKTFMPWRILTDTSEHFKIYTVLTEYRDKIITKTKAKEILANCDLTNMDTYKESAKKLLNEILGETQKVSKKNKEFAIKAENTIEPVENITDNTNGSNDTEVTDK